MGSISRAMMSDPSQQISSRFKVPLAPNDMKVRQSPTLEQVTDHFVQEQRAPVRSRPAESQRVYFPSESPMQRFRGDVIGRGVGQVSAGQELSRLPRQVRPFDPNLSSEMISSLNQAELAAIGATPSPARGDDALDATAREMTSSSNPVELAKGGRSMAPGLSSGVDVSGGGSFSQSGTLPSGTSVNQHYNGTAEDAGDDAQPSTSEGEGLKVLSNEVISMVSREVEIDNARRKYDGEWFDPF